QAERITELEHPVAGTAEGGGSVCLEGHALAGRVQVDVGDGPQAPLRARIVELERVDLVAEELDAHREAVERWEDVDHAAAHGEGAGVVADRHAGVTGGGQAPDQPLAVDR